MRVFGKRHEKSVAFLRTLRELSVAACVTLLIALGWSVTRLVMTSKASAIPRARLSQTITVHASGRGNPSINLSDGRDVLTAYSGPPALTQILQQNEAQPLTLASADFDEDGVADLICGYGHSSSGIIAWLRGNVDSIYENSPEAQRRRSTGEFTDAPFLSPARVFALPIAPEFLGAGDFDADGHWDVVAASQTSNALYLLRGDGRGGFGEATSVALPGTVTAFVTGEINRRDGLDDVVVAVNGKDGPKALVFEGPDGALKAKPEAFGLPGEARALGLGQMDDDYPMDLAIAAGRELIIIHGRDRKLSDNANIRAAVPPASISHWPLSFTVKSMAIGDFSGNRGNDVALLSGDGAIHLQSRTEQEGSGDKQILRVRDWSSVRLRSGERPQAHHLIRARVSGSAKDDLLLVDSASRQLHIVMGKPLDTGTVKSPSQAEAVSLDVEGEPVAVLPMRLNADARRSLVVLNSGHGSPSVLLPQAAMTFTVKTTADNGNNASPIPESLRAAIISANVNPGTDAILFNIPGPGVHTIAPLSPLPDIGRNGVREIINPVIIDGTSQPGFAGTPIIELVGTNVSEPCPGFQIEGGSSTVRGLVINRFPQDGIVLAERPNYIVEGNFIGTDASGTVARRNGLGGVGVFRSADHSLVGGTTASARNIISGNVNDGVFFSDETLGNQMQGNFVGTDVTGTVKIGNLRFGVLAAFGARNNTIGGTEIGARNLISGNSQIGVALFDSGTIENLIQNNFIGTDVTGTVAMGNRLEGILVNGAGSTSISDNTISSNGSHGVSLGGFQTDPKTGLPLFGGTGATVKGNFIGTDRTGTLDLGNQQCGVFVENDSKIHTIEENTIAFNKQQGICVPNDPGDSRAVGPPAFSIQMSRNQIFANTLLGIDLAEAGVTDNDDKDPDVGANTSQNFPVLARAENDGINGTTVQGELNSTPGETFTIEFFSNPGDPISGIQTAAVGPCNPQGQNFIGSTTVTTGSNGTAPINILLPGSTPGGFINCTATGPGGNTSEFSACVQLRMINADLSVVFDAAPGAVRPGGDLSYQVTVANNGPVLATNVVLTSQVPDNTTFQRVLAPAGWTSRLPDADKTGLITCETSALNVGTSASFTIVVRANPGAAEGTIIASSMRVSSGITDLKPGNNSVTAATIVSLTPPPPPGGGVDLSLGLKGSPGEVFAGDDITYTLTVTNPGLTPAKDVVLRQVLAGSTVLQSKSAVSGWAGEGPTADGVITFRNASVGPGDSVFTIVVKVKPETEAGASITTTALITSPSDPNDKNNSRSVTTMTVERPPGPEIQSITVTTNITVVGFGFVKPVQVFIDNIGFEKSAKVKGGTRVIQKGKLSDGRSIAEAVPPGKPVMMTFRNKDGGEKTVSFKN